MQHRVAILVGIMTANSVGCGEDPLVLPFRDELGRECVRTCDGDCDFTCEAEPMPAAGCGDLEPAFVVDAGTDEHPASLCDGCRGAEGAVTYYPADCAALVCERDRDCAFGNLRCVEGRCWDERFL